MTSIAEPNEIEPNEIESNEIVPNIAESNVIASPDIIAQCIKCINNKLYISYDLDLIIDPCAQNGEFVEGLSTLARNTLFYEKEPNNSHPRIRQADFLTIDFARFDKTFLAGLWYDDIHVIGCPPLDQIGDFIKACCKFGQSVSFLLPYGPLHLPKKDYKVYFPLNFQLLHEEKFDNIPYVFQIWLKTDL